LHTFLHQGKKVCGVWGNAPTTFNFLLSNSINDEQKIFNPDDIAKYPNCQNGDLAKVAKQFSSSEESEGQKEVLPTFPETIYPLLPDFLRQITNYANSGEDADLLLLGSLVVTSACLPNVYGIYGGVTVFPNLFLFVTAQASAGKGRISLCRRLVEPIHRRLRETNKPEYEEYKRQQAEYVANKKNPDAENGLFSRFIFYFMNVRLVWNDVFANDGADTLDATFCRIGEQFYDLYKILQTSSPHSVLFLQAPAGRIQRLFRWHTEAIRRPLRARYCRFGSPFRVDNLSHSHDFNHLANL
jgi:hypothetical protein